MRHGYGLKRPVSSMLREKTKRKGVTSKIIIIIEIKIRIKVRIKEK